MHMKNAVSTVERAAVQALVDHFYDNIKDHSSTKTCLQNGWNQ